jgi:hypothetical protein
MNMELEFLASKKKEHEAISAVISCLGRIGYLVNGICFKNGALEVICYPPQNEEIRQGYNLNEPSGHALSFDGIS